MADAPTAPEAEPLCAVLRAANVGRVIHVDDYYDLDLDRVADRAEAALEEDPDGLRSALSAAGVEHDLPEQLGADPLRGRLRKQLDEWAEGLGAEERLDRLGALANLYDALAGPAGEESETVSAADVTRIRTIVRRCPGVSFEAHAVTSWRKEYEDWLGRAGTATVVVLDDDTRTAPDGRRDEGRDFLRRVLQGDAAKRPHALLLTHNADGEEDARRLRDDIRSQPGFPRHGWHVVDKAALRDEAHASRQIARRMLGAVLARQLEVMRGQLKTASARAETKALDEIEALEDEVLEQTVVRAAQAEGSWPAENLRRLVALHHDRHLLPEVYGSPRIHDAVDGALALEAVRGEIGAAPGAVSEKRTLRGFDVAEMYLDGDLLRSCHLPIDLGDIFELRQDASDPAYYLLLAPMCQLAVRSDGHRGAAARQGAHVSPLAPVELAPLGRGKNEPHLAPLEPFLVERLNDEARGANKVCARLNRLEYLPTWLLDLAVLSEDGECRYARKQGPPQRLLPTWRKRFTVVAEEATRTLDRALVAQREVPAEQKAEVVRMQLGLPAGWSASWLHDEAGDISGFRLGICRVGRLKEPWSSDVLALRGSYLARTAFPRLWSRTA